MGRIPDVEIERLKREIPVARLAREAGVVLKQHGEELLGLCPFHDDKSPSLVINPSKNLWHCLGACQAGGSVIDWVMRARGLAFRDAVGDFVGKEPPQIKGEYRITFGDRSWRICGIERNMSFDVLRVNVLVS